MRYICNVGYIVKVVGSMIYSHSVQVVYFSEGDKLIHTFKKGDRKSTKLRDSSFCQSITLKVNYNFDFGHKKVEHKEVRVDKNNSNSILK